MISEQTIKFLSDLEKNNNREWFKKNKERYQMALDDAKDFLENLTSEMNKVDEIEGNKLFRIYRDVRFSKDKTPYSASFRMSLSRTKPWLRGGYFLKIAPKESMLACGFWNPSPRDINLIRKNIELDSNPMRQALSNASLCDTFGNLSGERVKSAPKGFSKEGKNIDLIRYKQFLFSKSFLDNEVLSTDFTSRCANDWATIRPFFDYMSDILTHDLNGEPLY